MTNAPGSPCWIQLRSSDAERSRDFYGRLFGWTAGEASQEFGGYFMFTRGEQPVAGGMPIGPMMTGASDGWLTYLAVEDARKSVETAEAAGAAVAQPAIDVADLGTSAVIVDPSGASVGLWQRNTFGGHGVGGPGTPAGSPCYSELHTGGFEVAVAFYRDVLGWDAQEQPVPGLRYATLGAPPSAAGIVDNSAFGEDEAGTGWQVYFAAPDVDAAIARAADLGATVIDAAMDTRYGRLASLDDPCGARFKLMGQVTG